MRSCLTQREAGGQPYVFATCKTGRTCIAGDTCFDDRSVTRRWKLFYDTWEVNRGDTHGAGGAGARGRGDVTARQQTTEGRFWCLRNRVKVEHQREKRRVCEHVKPCLHLHTHTWIHNTQPNQPPAQPGPSSAEGARVVNIPQNITFSTPPWSALGPLPRTGRPVLVAPTGSPGRPSSDRAGTSSLVQFACFARVFSAYVLWRLRPAPCGARWGRGLGVHHLQPPEPHEAQPEPLSAAYTCAWCRTSPSTASLRLQWHEVGRVRTCVKPSPAGQHVYRRRASTVRDSYTSDIAHELSCAPGGRTAPEVSWPIIPPFA
jgi:hypothetical protein